MSNKMSEKVVLRMKSMILIILLIIGGVLKIFENIKR